MKYTIYLPFFVLVFVAFSCGNKSEHAHDHDHDHATSTDALYDSVMLIHDEVMPKMNDIYKLKEELKKQIANSPDMIDEKRKEIETKIAALEEANESMMRWMREFNPPTDSLGEETVRTYLEGEMKKVKEVKETINGVLQ